MRVFIKDFAVTMEINKRGIEVDVSDNDGRHVGDLAMTKTRHVWCKGRTSIE